MSWNPIEDGVTGLNAADLNPILNDLSEQISALAVLADSNKIAYRAAGCAGLSKGTVVAFDGTKFAAAEPVWTIDPSSGRTIPSPLSYVVGILTSDVAADGTADLLVSGIINITESSNDNESGPVYLTSGGGLARGVPTGVLPVCCGYRIENDRLIFRPCAPDYTGHRHTEYTLSVGSWSTNVYTYTNDTTCAAILAAVPTNSIVCIADGVIRNFTVDAANKTLTISGISASPTEVKLFATTSLVSNDAEVRAIAPADGNNLLKVTKAFGTVYLDTELTPVASGNNNGTCVASITRSGIQTADVVNTLTAGGHISITGTNGNYTISDEAVGAYLDFQTINANNVLVGATANDAILTFPAGISSSVLGIVRLPTLSVGKVWSFRVFVWTTSGSTAGLTADVKIQTPPTAPGQALPVATTKEGVTINTGVLTASGNSLIQITLASTGTQVQVIAAGVYIATIE